MRVTTHLVEGKLWANDRRGRSHRDRETNDVRRKDISRDTSHFVAVAVTLSHLH